MLHVFVPCVCLSFLSISARTTDPNNNNNNNNNNNSLQRNHPQQLQTETCLPTIWKLTAQSKEIYHSFYAADCLLKNTKGATRNQEEQVIYGI